MTVRGSAKPSPGDAYVEGGSPEYTQMLIDSQDAARAAQREKTLKRWAPWAFVGIVVLGAGVYFYTRD